MNTHTLFTFTRLRFALAMAMTLLAATTQINAQCSEVSSGLLFPLGITQSNQGNLIVGESGLRSPNSGRISIVDTNGNRRTLLDRLPSGPNDVNDPSGPAGLFIRGRTLYVAIGIGDAIQAGPAPGLGVANPNPSSPLLSSVLAIHFSANVEKTTSGFALSISNQQALANGEKVTLTDQDGAKLTIEMVANFVDYTPNPLPTFPPNVRGSNPFDLVVLGDQIYVTDGGQNVVWQVDIPTGTFTVLTAFPPIPNLTGVGGPVIEAVPTGIRYADGQLLVALLRGVPFPPGVSQIVAVDPATGAQTPLIAGRKTAIDVLPITHRADTDYLVLQHASTGFFFASPGQVLRFETPIAPPALITDCLTRPSSMALDEKTNTLYVTEIGGRIVAIPIAP